MKASLSFVSATLGLVLAALVCAAKEPVFDYHVPLKPENVSLGYFPFDKAPILTVASGAVVKIDGGGGARWGTGSPDDWLKENNIKATLADTPALAETAEVLKNVKPPAGLTGGHMLVGPIAIEGAEPGDMLEIRIIDVTPRIPYGTVSAIPGRGGLPDLVPRPASQIVHLDLKKNLGIFDTGVEIPLKPFMGVMATCPPDSDKPLRRSSEPGVFGGNLDLKELVSGSTLYLPVFQKGALFYTGDSHAGQGDGEVTISAIETANTCTLKFVLHKGKKLNNPRAETPTHFIAIGLDKDLNKAMRQAMTETIDYLGEIKGYDFFKAYMLSSIGVDFHVTQVVDGVLGIHSMIPKSIFVDKKFEYWTAAKK